MVRGHAAAIDKGGEVFVNAGDSQRVVLPSLTDEIFWFCGGDRNRSANDEHFDVVKISRKDNGAISWTFFKSAPPAPSNLVRVGTTKDACDGSRQVKFHGKDGDVSIAAGHSRLVELSSPRNTLNWDCVPPSGNCPTGDVCDEHVSKSIAFDTVQVERAGHGTGAPACQFPGPREVARQRPRALDDDVDRCGSNLIWLRDSQKRHFIRIAKGQQNVIVEVESREFSWFCGGDSGPESAESAAGPVGTYLLRVSRAATGGQNRLEVLIVALRGDSGACGRPLASVARSVKQPTPEEQLK
jgi:hypothetical protein